MQRTLAADWRNIADMNRTWHRRQFIGSLAVGGAALLNAQTLRAASTDDDNRDDDPAGSWFFGPATPREVARGQAAAYAAEQPTILRSGAPYASVWYDDPPSVSTTDPDLPETSLVMQFRRAAQGDAVADARVTVRQPRKAEARELRSDARGRLVLRNLRPDAVIELSVRARKGPEGHFGHASFLRPVAGTRACVTIWLIDNYWPWDESGQRRRFPVNFFLETTFTPRLVRFRHPGDQPAGSFAHVDSGSRDLVFFLDPAFDETARSAIRSIIADEWPPMTDFRIRPQFETAYLPDDDPRARDSFRIVHDPNINIAELHQNFDKSGWLINSRASFSGSPNWREMSPYIVDLHCEFVREYLGFGSGPRFYDNKPWDGGPSFMRYPGARRYTWFDRNVVARVLYRLPANTVLRRGDVAGY